jgi:hypothetical protein
MLIPVVVVLVLIAVPLCGGKFSSLGQLRVRGAWLVAVAFGTQFLILMVVDLESDALVQGVHLATYAMIGVCIVVNRHLPWMWLVGIGWAANTLVITVNGGIMPTSESAARQLDRGVEDRFVNSAPLENARLEFFGDVIVSPGWLPMQNAFSVGDFVLVAGLGLMVWSASRRSVGADADAERTAVTT